MVKEPDQPIRISDIPSSALGCVKPICLKHHVPYSTYYTKRKENQDELTLVVTRKFFCEKCKAEGVIHYEVVRTSGCWKISLPRRPFSHKQPNDEN